MTDMLKNELTEKIIDIFVYETQLFKKENLSGNSNIVEDLKISSDDISIFLESVEKHFRISTYPEDWLTIDPPTFENIADFVLHNLSNPRILKKRNFWDNVKIWVRS